jgi:hypothetical protein
MPMTAKLAAVIKEMTWAEMDDFAEFIMDIATDDNGEKNDARYIAGALCGGATETLQQ